MITFDIVIETLKNGNMARRTSWETNTFIFRQVPSIISKDIVPKMQSLPQAVKTEFDRRFNDDSFQVSEIYYDNQIAIVNQSNLIQGWNPSAADIFAEDWQLIYG